MIDVADASFAGQEAAQGRLASAQWQRAHCVKNIKQLRSVLGDTVGEEFYADLDYNDVVFLIERVNGGQVVASDHATVGLQVRHQPGVNAADGRWCVNIQDGSTGNIVRNNILYNLHPTHGAIAIDSTTSEQEWVPALPVAVSTRSIRRPISSTCCISSWAQETYPSAPTLFEPPPGMT